MIIMPDSHGIGYRDELHQKKAPLVKNSVLAQD